MLCINYGYHITIRVQLGCEVNEEIIKSKDLIPGWIALEISAFVHGTEVQNGTKYTSTFTQALLFITNYNPNKS